MQTSKQQSCNNLAIVATMQNKIKDEENNNSDAKNTTIQVAK
jgi:hypothetical protein